MKPHGFVLSLDSLIALVIALAFVLALMNMHFHAPTRHEIKLFQEIHYTTGDAMRTGVEMNLMDALVSLWLGNETGRRCEAVALCHKYLNKTVPQTKGYTLTIEYCTNIDVCHRDTVCSSGVCDTTENCDPPVCINDTKRTTYLDTSEIVSATKDIRVIHNVTSDIYI